MPLFRALVPLAFLVGCPGEDGANKPKDSGIPSGQPTDVDLDGILSDTDCNDGNAAVFPGAAETCNGLDDDCNGTVDDGLDQTFFRDADGDGFGTEAATAQACAEPAGFTSNADDCNDTNAQVHPDATEVCDILDTDEDCSGLANEDDPNVSGIPTWYEDHDEDGYGDASLVVVSCFDVAGLASVAGDCNDADYDINPGTPEVCDPTDKDEDCDGLSDEADLEGPDGHPLYFVDSDNDDHGDMVDPGQYFCGAVPNGYVTDNTDCDDASRVINMDAPEHCADGLDNDCNGGVDDCGPIADIALDDANTILEYATSYAYFGQNLAALGDMNGDGDEDFGGSQPYAATYSGKVWIFEGPFPEGEFDIDDDASATIEGDAYGYLGQSMASAGDVDNDGYDDLIVGRYYNPGASYVVLGPVLGDSEISIVADAYWTEEISYDYGGNAVGGDFDFNDDGYDDYMMGAYQADTGSYYSSGATYLVFGPGLESDSMANTDVRIGLNASYAQLGFAVTGLGDMDGDGADEMASTALAGASYYGRVYVFAGTALSGDYDADSLAITHYDGVTSYDNFGVDIADGGDFNDDGYDDLLIGSAYSDTGGASSGSTFLVLGPPGSSGTITSVDAAEFYGETSGDYAGMAVDGAKDVNRDGFSDVLIGAPYYDGGGLYSSGAAYLVYGPDTGAVDLGNARCAMTGMVSNDVAGWDVAFIGDQDGDSSPEILVGAPNANVYGGRSYVIFGGRL